MRLRTRQQYQRMAQKTMKLIGQWIIVDVRVTQASVSRVGITATKRYGPSYQRNRFKRLVREAFRLACPSLTPTFDIVVRPRSQALQAKMQDIQQELLKLVEQALCVFAKSTSETNQT